MRKECLIPDRLGILPSSRHPVLRPPIVARQLLSFRRAVVRGLCSTNSTARLENRGSEPFSRAYLNNLTKPLKMRRNMK